MKDKKYFELTVNDNTSGGIAYASDDYAYEFFEKIKYVDEIPFDLILDNNIFEDFIANNIDWPLLSTRMKKIFDEVAKDAPKHKWLKTSVKSENGKFMQDYFFLVFPDKPDVLDFRKTKIINDDYVDGFFCYNKVEDFPFFPQQSLNNNNLLVEKELKDQLIRNKITGLYFELANLTFD